VDVAAPRSAVDVLRQGAALLARLIRGQPVSYAIATAGAVLFSAAIVASSFVIGGIVERVIIPVLDAGAPARERLPVAIGQIGRAHV
jgi:hypothetical protein